MTPTPRHPAGWHATAAAKERRERFLTMLSSGMQVKDALEALPWTRKNYQRARDNFADFAAAVDLILRGQTSIVDPNAPGLNKETPLGYRWKVSEGFASFRKYFLNHDSPWFHLEAIKAMEEMPEGSVLLILWPPEHGKTALWEDYDTYLLATQPSTRIAVGSEKQTQAAKVVAAIRARLENDAPGMERLRERFGPFAPQTAARGAAVSGRQLWGRNAFEVVKKPRGMEGERDPSMQAIGMGGTIIGTRTDLLQVDDPQSRRSLNKTEELVETFRQDWLSRPGAFGRTTVLANRVGEGDFHQALMETDLVDRVIQVPAWSDETGWAWPQRYSGEHYRAMRRRVGQEAWDRNYMQRGMSAKEITFNDETVQRCLNALRSILHAPPRGKDQPVVPVHLTLDPGFGRTAIMATGSCYERLAILDLRIVEGIQRYSQFSDLLDEMVRQFNVPGVSLVTDITIETKAFQRGLIQDEAIALLAATHGINLHPFETGVNKMDPSFGIPQMARSMQRGEIDIPYFDDVTKTRIDLLLKEFKIWRPNVKGNKLRQDLIMVLWFAWHHWRINRRILEAPTSNFDFGGLTPTR